MGVQKPFTLLFLALLIFSVPLIGAGGETPPDAEKLLRAGLVSADKTHYLEAVDLLEKARDILEDSGGNNSGLYADVMFALAETKIKARLHQDFPANYVKTALQDVQTANKLREKLSGVLPQKLAEGYYLEGYIHKRFFMRKSTAKAFFVRAVSIDPTSGAAKRELSELLSADEQK
ncbi:MAG: hypothetical protein HY912_12910 [Desulfomonile tiedjei]|uniref:Tetratricopeptide repeat protein n=1 Tax=Desulfomonile tiedjei TaxID=2358 RepID=A0A9D6V204_9BACT|nr:hypothetical protein [Desulfomonile tiedjei]